jgi:hypothetical protein
LADSVGREALLDLTREPEHLFELAGRCVYELVPREAEVVAEPDDRCGLPASDAG